MDYVTTLLKDAGYNVWLHYPAFAAAAALADSVAQRVEQPLVRAKFAACAAITLADWGPKPLIGTEKEIARHKLAVMAAEATPCGPTEIWGSFEQHILPVCDGDGIPYDMASRRG